jgi:hypothetical protein
MMVIANKVIVPAHGDPLKSDISAGRKGIFVISSLGTKFPPLLSLCNLGVTLAKARHFEPSEAFSLPSILVSYETPQDIVLSFHSQWHPSKSL